MEALNAARIAFCSYADVAEELVSLDCMSAFYGRHERHAKLIFEYAEASVVRDVVPRFAVQAYERTFRGA